MWMLNCTWGNKGQEKCKKILLQTSAAFRLDRFISLHFYFCFGQKTDFNYLNVFDSGPKYASTQTLLSWPVCPQKPKINVLLYCVEDKKLHILYCKPKGFPCLNTNTNPIFTFKRDFKKCIYYKIIITVSWYMYMAVYFIFIFPITFQFSTSVCVNLYHLFMNDQEHAYRVQPAITGPHWW